jgi:type II secretory ATPase GspE/PulE/Tfp pilus assembly ATPase PilB-like protein
MKNFYKELKLKDGIKKDKNFNKHFILPNSMILAIGGTGTGKTNSLLNMLQLMGPKFYDIIIFTTVDDEPLLNYLKKKIRYKINRQKETRNKTTIIKQEEREHNSIQETR